MKKKSISGSAISITIVFILLMIGTTAPHAFSQTSSPDNKKAHLVQWIPLRVLLDLPQVKLFYEYQPAASIISFGVAPSIRKGKDDRAMIYGAAQTGVKQTAFELQPFVSIVKHHPKSEFYGQFFLKASYFHQYNVEFETEEYYHNYTWIFEIYNGTYADRIYKPHDFYSYGGGCLAGYRKFLGSHWFIDINAGLQYLEHTKVEFPEEQSSNGQPYIKWSNFNSIGDPGSVFTSHLGFGYRFIKK